MTTKTPNQNPDKEITMTDNSEWRAGLQDAKAKFKGQQAGGETTGLIPAKNAQIHWSTIDHAKGGRVVDEIWIFDRTLPWEDREELECSAGACTSDWLDGTDQRSTPAGLYAQLAFAGFKDNATHLTVLDAFATIEGCDWAAQMATTYRWLMPLDADGEEA